MNNIGSFDISNRIQCYVKTTLPHNKIESVSIKLVYEWENIKSKGIDLHCCY